MPAQPSTFTHLPFSSALYCSKKCLIWSFRYSGTSSIDFRFAVIGQILSCGTATSFASTPDSSVICSMPSTRERTIEPASSGNGVITSTSTGSPSPDSVCGM